MLDADTCHGACEAKDRRFDGRFYVGVTSTGIYCRCICPARTPKRENRTFWPSAAAAEAAGFRPCFVCRPELAPGFAPIDAPARLAAQAYARIEAGALEEQGLEALAADLGVTGRHLRRVMNAQFGASPIDLAQTSRLLAAKRLLGDTDLSITEIAFASGFRSLRRFNATIKDRYGVSPTRLRGRRAAAQTPEVTLQLAAREPFVAAPSFEFLRTRALPGVETCTAKSYTRTLSLNGAAGWIDIRPGKKGGLALSLSENLAPQLRPLIAAVRGAFDLDCDIAMVDAHLARDARFAPLVKGEASVRIPGAIDGFETAIRATLGQQVTVAGARTLTSRLVERFGEDIRSAGARAAFCSPVYGTEEAATPFVSREARAASPALRGKNDAGEDAGAPSELSRLFPSAARLADAGVAAIASIGVPKKRAETLAALARASAEGKLPLMRGAIASGRAALAAIPGIGPWTIEYVALRALGDPDAYPAADSALIAALGKRGETLDHLRPWRAYAAVRLWRGAAAKLTKKGP